jgi:beta-carotene 3-hydroxylase
MLFLAYIMLAFVGMEILSYVVHRYLFHGLLWRIHKTHHEAHHGIFELNDVFSTFFALAAIVLIILGANDPFGDPRFGLGMGITVYGILYFIIHDLFTHRRFLPFSSESRLMRLIRRAHQRHHQTADKVGNEPYGLFLFPYSEYPDRKKKEERRKTKEGLRIKE